MLNLILTIVLSLVSAVGVYNFAPLKIFEIGQNNPKTFGTSIQTIAGSDTISSSRTTINNNFTALNNGKFELSDWYATTSARQLIDLGIMSGGAVTASYGGTASTSLAVNQVMIGNGTSGFKIVGLGTSGQFFTSGGVGNPPSWTTGGVDQTLDYNWTGTTRIKNLNASSTVANPIVLNTVSYNTPSTQGSANTVLANDGSGNLTWDDGFSKVLMLNTTTAGSGNGATTTLATYTMPASQFGIGKLLRIHASASNQRAGNPTCGFDIDFGNGSATTTISTLNMNNLASNYLYGEMNVTMYATTTTAQITNGKSFTVNAPGGADANYLAAPLETLMSLISHTYPLVNLANQSYISFSTKLQAGSGTCRFEGMTIELLAQ